MRYSNDPRWIDTRYKTACGTCKEPIARDDRAYYYPASKTLLCETCGRAAARDFAAAAFDEAVYSGQ